MHKVSDKISDDQVDQAEQTERVEPAQEQISLFDSVESASEHAQDLKQDAKNNDQNDAFTQSFFGNECAWDGNEVQGEAASNYDPMGHELSKAELEELESVTQNTKRTPPPRKTPEERAALSQADEEKPERAMTLMEHLGELRTRLVRSFIAVGLAFMVCYTFAEQLFAELCKPLVNALPEGSKLIFTALPEAFFVYLKVGLVAAIFVVSPYLFYQVWSFIAPGLYDEEKKYMIPMALISAFFFISGASFCFFVVFPYAFTFFVGFASEDIAAMPSLGEYLGFSLKLLIAFGLIFEMPLFTFFLARMGIVTADRMRSFRRYAVLCIFITAAILTPPDVISQLLMAMPMMLLYEVSIGVAAVFGRKKKTEAEEVEEDLSSPIGDTAKG